MYLMPKFGAVLIHSQALTRTGLPHLSSLQTNTDRETATPLQTKFKGEAPQYLASQGFPVTHIGSNAIVPGYKPGVNEANTSESNYNGQILDPTRSQKGGAILVTGADGPAGVEPADGYDANHSDEQNIVRYLKSKGLVEGKDFRTGPFQGFITQAYKGINLLG